MAGNSLFATAMQRVDGSCTLRSLNESLLGMNLGQRNENMFTYWHTSAAAGYHGFSYVDVCDDSLHHSLTNSLMELSPS
jgi:hypothetical protein